VPSDERGRGRKEEKEGKKRKRLADQRAFVSSVDWSKFIRQFYGATPVYLYRNNPGFADITFSLLPAIGQ
jgi:hypothetical protein